MTSSWKQFWSSEERKTRSLCLLGMLLGLTIGMFSKDWTESFYSIGQNPRFAIEIFGHRIPSFISFGAVVGLDIQIISVVAIWIALKRDSKLYVPVTWLLFGIPFGILTIFNVLSDRLVSAGFIIPYVFDLLLPFIAIVFVGMDAMCFLAINALYLLPFYIASTGIVWLLAFSRSMA
jgi:hypothetical protein